VVGTCTVSTHSLGITGHVQLGPFYKQLVCAATTRAAHRTRAHVQFPKAWSLWLHPCLEPTLFVQQLAQGCTILAVEREELGMLVQGQVLAV